MNNFIFKNGTKVIFGKSTEELVGIEVKKYTDKVLLHYGGGSIKRTGLYDTIIKSLDEHNIEVFELGGVKPNPRLTLVQEGIDLCRSKNIDFILAVGGGSVIDSAKAIGVGVNYEGNVWDFYDYKTSPEKSINLGVILTIPAAGSETSPSSVITNEKERLKRGVTADCMRPEFAILNPELTYTLPDYQTACGAADMLAHVMERYFVQTEDVRFTDRLCEATMKTIIEQAEKLIYDTESYAARSELMWCGTVAHNDILDTGRGGDWASHSMEHEISAMNDIAHGAGLAIVFPAWMKYVYRENKGKFLQFTTRVFNIDQNFDDPDETILKGIKALETFFTNIGLPTRLSDIEFDESLIPEMAQKATLNGPIGSFKSLLKDDVEKIYNLAL
ncbi:MAG: iron-containing alcohol dehydrogenase [Spirochaetales bacterium]|nr:iron-containing alcohol dehydrogenase [Spirochaetales bacterium]